MPVALLAQAAEIFGVVEPHRVGALEDWLQDDARDLVGVICKEPAHRLEGLLPPRLVKSALRGGDEELPRQNSPEDAVHLLGVAHGHGADRVAVVSTQQRGNPCAPGTTHRILILKRHLDGAFDCNRPRISIEDLLQPGGQNLQKPGRKVNRGTMGQAAEHDMGHLRNLLLDCVDDFGAAVAMRGAPPGGDAVDERRSVLQVDMRAAG